MPFMRAGTLSVLVLFFVGLGGCGGYSAEEHRVDSTRARSLLEEVLTSWKEGQTPESWRERTPEVVVQDLEWQQGAKLKAFAIQGPGEAVDANLHCHVKLILEDAQNKEVMRTVKYLVGTSPVFTVFREPAP